MGFLTDEMFNAYSRDLKLRLDIYLDEEPITVTDDNYLMEASWLEEASADSKHPFGSISANELTFKLFNEEGLFSPANKESPYFALIKPGVKVVLYIKCSDSNWQKLGEYFVTNWTAPITGIYADVVAYDIMQTIFNSLPPLLPVVQNTTFKAFFEELFTAMGFPVDVNDSLEIPLPFAFIKGNPKEFLNSLVQGALAYCSCNADGMPIIDSFIRNRDVRAVITDNDQIKAASIPQSLIRNYDGVKITYNIPQIASSDIVLDMSNIVASPGITELRNLSYSKGPVWDIKYITVEGPVTLSSYSVYPWLVDVELLNESNEDQTVSIQALGRALAFTQALLSDNTSRLLEIENQYIQSLFDATIHKDTLAAFINDSIPTLSISARGNPLLKVGDRLLVESDRYRLEYDGIIKRLYYTYRGNLSCSMDLITSAVMQEV